MARMTFTKTNFTAGEVSPDLAGRGDLRAYDNGAMALRNLFISPTGGARRRAGLRYVAALPDYARLVSYEYTADLVYMLAFTNLQMHVYQEGILVTSIAAPWTSAQLDQINWAHGNDSLLIAHPDVPLKKITRSALGGWSITDLTWAKDTTGNISYQPYHKFAVSDITLYSAGTSGSVTITASSSVFSASYVGVRLRIRSTECTITGYTNPTTVTATVHGSLAASPATTDWSESAFSSLRGYPISVAYHQNRLVIGGAKSLPSRLWLSKTGDLFNFNTGTGLDDEAIAFSILSDQINTISGVMSGRHLQIFTSGAEWVVTGDPLTPANLQLKRQTKVGSVTTRTIPVVDVDGATLFIARNQNEIREFLYTDIEQAYQATDLALLSRGIMNGAIDQAYDKARRMLFIVRDDGKCASLTMYRAEQVAAWTLHETDGAFCQVIAVGDTMYAQIERDGVYYLEAFDDALSLDSAIEQDLGAPGTLVSGLDHLEGKTIKILADGAVIPDQVVLAGSITLSAPAQIVQTGLAFTHRITPLPSNRMGLPPLAHKIRLVRLTLRLQETRAMRIDMGLGVRDLILSDTAFTGDVSVIGHGWHVSLDDPLWSIESNVPLSFELLSMTTEIQVN